MGIRKAQGQKSEEQGRSPEGRARSGWEQRQEREGLGPVGGNLNKAPLLLFLPIPHNWKTWGKPKPAGHLRSAWLPGGGEAGRWRARGSRCRARIVSWPRAGPRLKDQSHSVPPRLHSAPQQGQGGGGPLAGTSTPVSEPTGAPLGPGKHGPPKPVGVTSYPGGWEKRRLLGPQAGSPGPRPACPRPAGSASPDTRSSPR